jgi:hypothetical protein
MKIAGINRERLVFKFSLSVSCFFLCLLTLSGCGLEVVDTVLEEPRSDGHNAYYSSSDFTSRYFSFMTYEKSPNVSSSTFKFLGTAVYYKIFNNYSTMISYQSAVSTLNTDSNYTSAIEKMTDTQGYKQLKISYGSITPLIKASGSNKYVYIRLTNYGSSIDYGQGICVGDAIMTLYSPENALTYNAVVVYPRRNINSSYTFNFGGSNSSTDVVPKSTDDDVCWSSTTSESGKWYVDMYAVSEGLETDTWTVSYSQLLHLGSITIVEGENN